MSSFAIATAPILTSASVEDENFEFIANSVPFDLWKENHWEQKAGKPFEVTIGDTTALFFLRRPDFTREDIKNAVESFHNTGHCIECKTRISKLIRLIDVNGNSVLFPNSKDSYPEEFHDLWELAHRKVKSPHGFELELVQQDHWFSLTCGNDADSGEEFPHINIWPESHASIPKNIETCVQAGYHKYYHLILGMFTTHGVEGITESLRASIALIDSKDSSDHHKIPYGNKIKYAFEWMEKHITDTFSQQSCLDQVMQVTRALFSANLTPNREKATDPIMTIFHQMNTNGLDIMNCSRNEKAFIAIMKDRFNPNTYHRPVAAPSVGQIDNAMRMLGEFENTIMTYSQAINDFGAVPYALATDTSATAVAVTDIHSSMNAFEKMKISANPKGTSGAAGFAARTKGSDIILPTTMQELLKLSGISLEINVSTMHPSTACTTTLGSKVKYPHLWMFHNGESPSVYGMNDWVRVTAILPMCNEGGRFNNYLFVCSSAKPKSVMPNCCFPAFLSIEYERTCRSAFEQLNKLSHPIIPSEGPYAMGVGTSITGSDGSFLKAMRIRVNGKEVSISKYA